VFSRPRNASATPRMMAGSRGPWPVVAIALLAGALALPAPAAATHRRCVTLKGRRLLSTRAAKVVEQRVGESGAYVFTCAPRDGTVHLAGSAHDATVSGLYSISVVAAAGSWIALDFVSRADPDSSEEIEKVCDARSGHSYRFFEAGVLEVPGFEPREGEPAIERLALNRYGQLALALSTDGAVRIVAYGSGGLSRTLDTGSQAQIPPSSMKLDGHTLSWTDAGVARSATL
jgi:hypothetical protein